MFSGGFSAPSGKEGDRDKTPKRLGKDSAKDKDNSDDDELSEWEWTPAERRRFDERGIRPTQKSRDAERAARAAEDALRHQEPADPRLTEEVAQRLRDKIRESIRGARTGTDSELFSVLGERFYIVPETQRPTEAQILDRAVQYMNITNRILPRDAVMGLAQANWDYEFAVARHFDGRPAAPIPEVGPSVDVEAINCSGPPSSDSELTPPPQEVSEAVLRRQLNVNINRDSAKKDHRDDSKLTITIKNPKGKADSVYRYPKAVRGTIDFTNPERVRALNRWRNQIFRRQIGPTRERRAIFHELEKQFLIDAVKEFERQRKASGQAVKWSEMNWYRTTRDFNAEFEGRLLRGSTEVRPRRTVDSLRTERNRIKAITDLTGGAPRHQKDNRQGSEADSEKDEGKQELCPKRLRRGDPAPGKPPRARSPDSDDEDTYGSGNLGWGLVGIRA